ncbi:MAG: ABC transporter substrate-binding protein [Candidatus Lindowbacteria bacterium]|nr:ABC transporter substrate-binding protein [Candidatus Lindowbacteria bacterium]
MPEYNTAINGFLDVFSEQRIKCKALTYNLEGQTDEGTQIITKIRAFKPDLILTVGSRATGVMSKSFRDTPIVFSMVLYPVASAFVANMEKPGANVTGAAMDVPIERQLRTLSRIVPRLKRVGVLYNPDETLPVIEEARRVAKAMNMQMIAESVDAESDVPDALGKLEKQKIDALWSVADGKVFTRPSTRYIIEYVLHRGIPFMGPHNGFVKAGALVALTADYRENGRQAGEIAIQIVNGARPENVPVAIPRKVEMALNLQVANNIGLKIPQSIISDASQVFE